MSSQSLQYVWYHNWWITLSWKLCFTYVLVLCVYTSRVWHHLEKVFLRTYFIIFRMTIFHIFRFYDVHMCIPHICKHAWQIFSLVDVIYDVVPGAKHHIQCITTESQPRQEEKTKGIRESSLVRPKHKYNYCRPIGAAPWTLSHT